MGLENEVASLDPDTWANPSLDQVAELDSVVPTKEVVVFRSPSNSLNELPEFMYPDLNGNSWLPESKDAPVFPYTRLERIGEEGLYNPVRFPGGFLARRLVERGPSGGRDTTEYVACTGDGKIYHTMNFAPVVTPRGIFDQIEDIRLLQLPTGEIIVGGVVVARGDPRVPDYTAAIARLDIDKSGRPILTNVAICLEVNGEKKLVRNIVPYGMTRDGKVKIFFRYENRNYDLRYGEMDFDGNFTYEEKNTLVPPKDKNGVQAGMVSAPIELDKEWLFPYHELQEIGNERIYTLKLSRVQEINGVRRITHVTRRSMFETAHCSPDDHVLQRRLHDNMRVAYGTDRFDVVRLNTDGKWETIDTRHMTFKEAAQDKGLQLAWIGAINDRHLVRANAPLYKLIEEFEEVA